MGKTLATLFVTFEGWVLGFVETERTKWYQQHKMTKNTEGEGVAMMNTVIPNRFGFSSNIHTNQ